MLSRLGNRPAPFSAGSAQKVLTGAALVTPGPLGILHCSDSELGEDLLCWDRACLSLAPEGWWSDLMGAECLVGAEDEVCQISSKRPSAKVFNWNFSPVIFKRIKEMILPPCFLPPAHWDPRMKRGRF